MPLKSAGVWFDDSLDVPFIPKVCYPTVTDTDISWIAAEGDLFGVGWLSSIDQPIIGRMDPNLYLGELIPQTFGPFNWIRGIADNVGLTDVAIPNRNLTAVLQNNVGITDVLIKTVDFMRSVLNTAGVTDVLSKQGTFNRSVVDGVGVTDAGMPSVMRNIVLAVIAESVVVTDAGMPSVMRSIAVSLANTVGLTDVLIKAGIFNNSIRDNVGVTDVIIKQADYIRVLSESVGVTDVVAAYFAAISHYLYARAMNWVLQARKNESS
jgi:ribosomal protein S5